MRLIRTGQAGLGGGVTVVSIDVKSQNTESGVMWANLRGRDEIARELCERGAYD